MPGSSTPPMGLGPAQQVIPKHPFTNRRGKIHCQGKVSGKFECVDHAFEVVALAVGIPS